jgi:hypothetical protein
VTKGGLIVRLRVRIDKTQTACVKKGRTELSGSVAISEGFVLGFGLAFALGEDLTKQGMLDAFSKFAGKVEPRSTALIFFSGYGVPSERRTYLIPINAEVWREADVRRDGVALDRLLADLDAHGAASASTWPRNSVRFRMSDTRQMRGSAFCWRCAKIQYIRGIPRRRPTAKGYGRRRTISQDRRHLTPVTCDPLRCDLAA